MPKFENYSDLTDQLTRQTISKNRFELTAGLPEARQQEIFALIDQVNPRNDIDTALYSYFQLYNLKHLSDYLTDIKSEIHQSARQIIRQGITQLETAINEIPTIVIQNMPLDMHLYIMMSYKLLSDPNNKLQTLTYDKQKGLFKSLINYQNTISFSQTSTFKTWPNHESIIGSVKKQITTPEEIQAIESKNRTHSTTLEAAVATAYILSVSQLISQMHQQFSRHATSTVNSSARESFISSISSKQFDFGASPQSRINEHADQVINQINLQVFDDQGTLTQIGRLLCTMIKIMLPILLVPDMIEAHQRCGDATKISLFSTRSQKEANYFKHNLKTLKVESLDKINHPPQIEMTCK